MQGQMSFDSRWKRVQGEQGFCFFNDTATTEIYTLALHDALPIKMTTDYWGKIVQVDQGVCLGKMTTVLCKTTKVFGQDDRGIVQDVQGISPMRSSA